jgi:hypothetical protein
VLALATSSCHILMRQRGTELHPGDNVQLEGLGVQGVAGRAQALLERIQHTDTPDSAAVCACAGITVHYAMRFASAYHGPLKGTQVRCVGLVSSCSDSQMPSARRGREL